MMTSACADAEGPSLKAENRHGKAVDGEYHRPGHDFLTRIHAVSSLEAGTHCVPRFIPRHIPQRGACREKNIPTEGWIV